MFVVFTADGGVVLAEDGLYKKFDKFGKYKEDVEMTPSLVNSKSEVDFISVLTSVGGTDLLIEEGGGRRHKEGSLNTVMDLTERRGYLRRVRLSGESGGIKFTQTIFLYHRGEVPCI